MKYTPPEGYEFKELTIMSNFDREIQNEVVDLVLKEKIVVGYPGWNFFGHVWYVPELKVFKCDIWQYQQSMEIMEADSLESLMEVISNKYGWD